MGCDLTMEGVRQLSLALGSFNTSLKHFNFSHNRIGNGQLVDVILALSMHSQLENIEIIRMNIGSNECTALSTLLRNTTKQLQTLWLGNNNIDDEGWSLWSMLLVAANWLSLALHAIQQSQAKAGRRCQLGNARIQRGGAQSKF